MKFTKPSLKKLVFIYKDGSRNDWKVTVSFVENKKSVYKNDKDYYSSEWNVSLEKDGEAFPLKIELSTQYDLLPSSLEVSRVIMEYFSNFALGFVVNSFIESTKCKND